MDISGHFVVLFDILSKNAKFKRLSIIYTGCFMDLKLKEVAEQLKVSEKTIYRWIKDGSIPFYRINHQYRFRTDEINQWAINKKYELTDFDRDEDQPEPVSVLKSLANGGIYYMLSGKNMQEALPNAVSFINLPKGLDKQTLLAHLLNREKMASTAIGGGVALPHPRNPIVAEPASESISICFLNTPFESSALDNIPVHTLIIILSATQTRHLQVLSKISYLCRQDQFAALLQKRALREEIFSFLRDKNI